MMDDRQKAPYLPDPQEEAKHPRVHIIRLSNAEALRGAANAARSLFLTFFFLGILPIYLSRLMGTEVFSDPKAAMQLGNIHRSLIWLVPGSAVVLYGLCLWNYLKLRKHSVDIGEGWLRIRTEGVLVAERSLTGSRFLIRRNSQRKTNWLLLFENGEELSLPEMAYLKYREISDVLKAEVACFSETDEVIHRFESPGRVWFCWIMALIFGGFCIASLVVTWVSAQILLLAAESPQWIALAFPVLISGLFGWGAFGMFKAGRKRSTLLTDTGIALPHGSPICWEDIEKFYYCRDGENGRICYTMRRESPSRRVHSIHLAQAMTQDEVNALWKKLGERVTRFRSQSEEKAGK